jgi:hypothetical protein
MLDRDGTDWIGWSSASGSAGEYRGIPNTGQFHPGYDGGASITSNALDTPLPKVTIESTRNGWGARWEFFPTYAKMTLHTVPSGTYWLLYEGNPGGAVDAADRVHLSNGRDYSANDDYPWSAGSSPPDDFEDIENTSGSAPEAEWVFFAASEVNRSLFLAHTDDALEDDYWQMEDNMTVFGFGRSGGSSLLTNAGAELVIGFVESTNAVTVAAGIHSAWNGSTIVNQVATPVIAPNGGTFTGGVNVALSCATGGAQIRYTLDGTSPTAGSDLYSTQLAITSNTTVKARGFRAGWLPGDVAEASFTILPDDTPPVLLSATALGDPNRVDLLFDEALESDSASAVTNYAVTPGITVLGAGMPAGDRTVRLSVSTLSQSVSYTVTVTRVSDLAGNAMSPTSTVFSFSPIDLTTSLVAHWRMDEREGGAVPDSTGDHDGTLQGPTREAGKLGRALRFDGIDDYVDCGAWDVSGQALTICAWLHADTFTHLSSWDARILSKADGVQENDHTWMLSTIKDGSAVRLRFRLKTGGSTTTLIASSGDLAAGGWIHAAFVYNGSQMILYKDGVPVGSAGKTGDITAEPGLSVWLGGNPSGASDRPFDGLLDDVRVYARALASNEVAYLAAWSPAATIEDWGAGYGVPTGDLTLDSEGDGISLLEEYAFGLNPTAVDPIQLQPGEGTKGMPWMGLTEGSPRRLAAEYVLRTHASDLIYHVTFADSVLSGWTPPALTGTATRIDSSWERVRLEDHLSTDDRTNRFMRMAIEYAP